VEKFKQTDLTEKIIQAFLAVYHELGYGFSKSIYHRALVIELTNRGLSVESEKAVDIYYQGHVVGTYNLDIIVDNIVILEIKTIEYVRDDHEIQLMNYLVATDKEIGLLLNFGKKPEIKRKIYDNERKKRRK
jgi:GxxExxY protein